MAGLDLALVVSLADRASQPLRRLSGAVDALGERAAAMGRRLSGIGQTASLRLTLPIAGAAGFALKAAADMEQMETAYTSMLGDAGKAKSLVEELMNFAARTPFQLQGIGGATRQLLAMGVEQDKVIEDLKLIGDVAAGAQVPIEEMTQIYAKGLAKGKVQAEELNQMSERGVPILQALVDLAARYGNDITKEDVYKAAERGEIGFKAMREALELLTEKGGVFHDQMRLQSETAAGLASTLKDNLFNAAVKVGEKIEEVFGVKEGMKDLIAWVQDMTARFERFAEENPELLQIGFALGAIAAAAGPLLIGLGLAAVGFSIFAGALAAILSPIGLVIGAVVAAGAVAAWLIADWEGASAFFEQLWKDILAAIPDDPFGWLQRQWDAVMDYIEAPAAAVWSWIENGVPEAFGWVSRQWDAALDWIEQAFPAVWSWLSTGAADVFAWVSRQWDAALDLVEKPATAVWNWLKNPDPTIFSWIETEWAQTLAAIGAGSGVSIGLDLPTAAEALAWAGGALTAIAAAIDRIDWGSIGKMIGRSVRAGFLALMSIFDSDGTAGGETKSAFRRVFAGIGDLIKSILKGALDAAVGFIEGVFGVNLEKALGDAVDAVTGWLPDWVRDELGLTRSKGERAQPSRIPTPPPAVDPIFGGSATAGNPAAAAAGRQDVQVGGEVRIVIDQEGKARLRGLESDNRDIALSVESGFSMASP